MRTVSTTKQLEDGIKSGEKIFHCEGELARKLRKAQKTKKIAKWGGGVLVLASIAAIPFTGGASAAGIVAGLTVGTVTISTAELAILVGGAVALVAILKDKKVKLVFNKDGSVELEVK